MRKLEDKVAIVTGASKGIGASIARHLAARAMSARTLRRGPRSGGQPEDIAPAGVFLAAGGLPLDHRRVATHRGRAALTGRAPQAGGPEKSREEPGWVPYRSDR